METFRIKEADLKTALARAEANYAQLERMQSQLRAIIDASQDAMLVLTPDGRPIRVNRSFSRFFDLDDTTVLSQLPDQLLLLLKNVFVASEAAERWLTWSVADQEHIFHETHLQIAFSKRDVELSSVPVKNVDQSYLGRLYVWHDVTNERAVARMKDEFVSMVTHELRSPLTSIQSYVQLLLREKKAGSLTETQREYLRIIENSVHHLTKLTNDLLDLSRLESGRIELQREPLDLSQLIRDLLPSFQPGWEEKRQSFTARLPELGPLVSGDAARVTQILTNLLSNAHKYTPLGGSIDLSLESDESCATVSVADSGIGLSTEEQAQLFTRFFRANNATTKTESGTGLGLVITRTLVEMQGGEIQVSSTPGQGSTFCFTLPLLRFVPWPGSSLHKTPDRGER